MSRQSSEHPDGPEVPRSGSTRKKDKPWSLWCRNSWPGRRKQGDWFRWGRYQTREEAEEVMRRQMTLKVWRKDSVWRVTPSKEKPE